MRIDLSDFVQDRLAQRLHGARVRQELQEIYTRGDELPALLNRLEEKLARVGELALGAFDLGEDRIVLNLVEKRQQLGKRSLLLDRAHEPVAGVNANEILHLDLVREGADVVFGGVVRVAQPGVDSVDLEFDVLQITANALHRVDLPVDKTP